jgi:hypothetical protein
MGHTMQVKPADKDKKKGLSLKIQFAKVFLINM